MMPMSSASGQRLAATSSIRIATELRTMNFDFVTGCSPISGSCPAAQGGASPVPAPEIEGNPRVGDNKVNLAWGEVPHDWLFDYPNLASRDPLSAPRAARRALAFRVR